MVVASRSANSGDEAKFVVVALDENNRQVRDYAGTVTLTTTDEGATLESDCTFTAADRGRHFFLMTVATEGTQTVTLATTGSQTITATDDVNGEVLRTATVRVINASSILAFGGRR